MSSFLLLLNPAAIRRRVAVYKPGPAQGFFTIIISKDLKVDATLPFCHIFNDFSQ